MSSRVAVFSAKTYDRRYLEAAVEGDPASADGSDDRRVELVFYDAHLDPATASLAAGARAVCAFVNDDLSSETLTELGRLGVELVAMRCAGVNNVDIDAARTIGLRVSRVPDYSPYAVAEHTMGLVLSLNRKIPRANNRVRENNFALDGLLGFDLHGRTVGVVGTGKIGAAFVRICRGFGMEVLACDPQQSPECLAAGARYVGFDELIAASDIISLHCPLTESTHHLLDAAAVARMKPGVMLINTSRGALVDTRAVIDGLKSGTIAYLGLDVYEEESDLFFEDLSSKVIADDVFARLLTFPNVLVTGHQGFFTSDALTAIADTTVASIRAVLAGHDLPAAVMVA
jgi:D-lactate dehydrogenase